MAQAAGLSQEQLAEGADVHRTYVCIIERGIGNPTLTVIADLAEALGITLSEIASDLDAHG